LRPYERRGKMEGVVNCGERAISKEAFKKLFLLYAISRFKKGVFGKKRLHKIVYIIERELEIKPFEFKKYFYGQYSEGMDEIQDQLLSMGYLLAAPLNTTSSEYSGNLFTLADKDLAYYYSILMEKIHPSLTRKIDTVINDYGYLSEKDLVEKAYSFPEFIHAKPDDTIFSEELPDTLDANGLSDDDIEELEIGLNPRFVNLINRIDNVIEQDEFDLRKVKKVVSLV